MTGRGTSRSVRSNSAQNEESSAAAAELPFTSVQLSGMVVMKIIKHYNDESSLNLAQGVLLGLLLDKSLEITNCFPVPASKPNDDALDEDSYQLAVMHRWKTMNADNFIVGWYQSAEIGSCLTLNVLESLYHYQTNIEESIVIVYDTQKSTRGFLCFKAYRLTLQAIKMFKENNFTTDALRNLKISYESLFAEVPIVVRNSPLTNIMMSEITEMLPEEEGNSFLDLSTASVLESQMKSLIDRMDELYPEVLRYNRYQQVVQKQETDKYRALAKLAAENSSRVARGEIPISDEDVLKQFRPIAGPARLGATLTSCQINSYAQHMAQVCTQSLAKLFISETLQKAKDDSSNTKENK